VNELLEEWLPEEADVDPKIGGKYELFWDPNNKEINNTLGCKVTGIEKDKFISFNWKGPVQFQSYMNVADPLTHVIVFFLQDKTNSKKIFVHLFHTGWRKDSQWQEARNYFEKAWSNALLGLKEKIKRQNLI
jgi:hypothetical protein